MHYHEKRETAFCELGKLVLVGPDGHKGINLVNKIEPVGRESMKHGLFSLREKQHDCPETSGS